MGARNLSPGGALLRGSRMFAIPKPLPESQANGQMKSSRSATMTKTYPQYQAITSPMSSREKGDWGLKRPFPILTTMTTSTPLIRVKKVDTIESVTDFASASDHTLSLEKFQEMRIVMSLPKSSTTTDRNDTSDTFITSVFEEDADFTFAEKGQRADRRWRFSGPWLASMTEGELNRYMEKVVRPRRSAFRSMLKKQLAEEMTVRQNTAAKDAGQEEPRKVEARNITEDQFLHYLQSLRKDRITLYALITKFLDLAPLAEPTVGFVNSFSGFLSKNNKPPSPYGMVGPPPSHPSAGISYLRTSAVMENHPVYGPQGKQAPVQARVLYPRVGGIPAKLGVGGFVANTPAGDNEFNTWRRFTGSRKPQMPTGIRFLDTSTPGGAKTFVEPRSAHVDSAGRVVVKVVETGAEAQLIAKENQGKASIYDDSPMERIIPQPAVEAAKPQTAAAEPVDEVSQPSSEEERMSSLAEELLGSSKEDEKEVLSSSSIYGLADSNDKSQS